VKDAMPTSQPRRLCERRRAARANVTSVELCACASDSLLESALPESALLESPLLEKTAELRGGAVRDTWGASVPDARSAVAA
jgi:hypothetical protein